MKTDRINTNGGTQAKGGKDTTRTILTAAGAVAVGAGGVIAATELLDNDSADIELTPVIEEPAEEQELLVTAQQETTAAQQQTDAQQEAQQPQQEVVEIQPVDSNTAAQQTEQPTTPQTDNQQVAQADVNNSEEEGHTTDIIDDVDPDLIAEEITATEVDPNDVDMADIIQVDMVDVLYFEDGTEMPYVTLHTPDGGEFLMVDVDNDLTFDVITDLEGNPVAAVEANLTMSDVEDMMDESGLELAFNEEQNEMEHSQSEDPEEDIVVTDEEEYLAMENELDTFEDMPA